MNNSHADNSDLHLHSKYSRAVSPQMIFPTMSQVALEKGLQLLVLDWSIRSGLKKSQALWDEAGRGFANWNIGTEQMQSMFLSQLKSPQFTNRE